jgi:mRNA-degrading endonuclease toxin of MazEF toxin-antitoxin module
VLVEPDAVNGLRRPSVALVFQLTAVDRRFIGPVFGAVSQEVMASVWEALDEITGR